MLADHVYITHCGGYLIIKVHLTDHPTPYVLDGSLFNWG
nr:MAG TPA: hypothetical protein [Bacteriophage sp.]